MSMTMGRMIPLMRAVLLLILVGLGAQLHAQDPAPAPMLGEKVRIEDEVLARWERVSTQVTGDRAKAWLDEGRQVLARYRELLDLESRAKGEAQGEVNIEISKLKLRLVHLLRSIEESRLKELDPVQLDRLRAEYEKERVGLLLRRDQVRDTVLGKGERFLENYRRDRNLQRFSQRDVVAKLCLQLAELYYGRSEERYFAAQDSLMARAERGLPAGLEPVRNFEDAVRKYQRVIDEFPFSDFMDDALYSVAYIRENSPNAAEVEESRRLYEHLVRDFPGSVYAPEAWMRLGEYWFRQPGEESLRNAIASYQKILEYPDYPAQEKALYKLGWCHYRLQEHETSVDYFAQASLYAVRKQGTEGAVGADLLDESIAYIAVNYADPDWDKANVGQLTALVSGNAELKAGVGHRLMERYGDLFKDETQDYSRAVAAYDSLLAQFPNSPTAPLVQEKIISCYAPGALADAQVAYVEKNQLYERYAGEGPWRADSLSAAAVDQLLERHQEENVAIAMDHAYATDQRADFDEFITQSRRYLKSFPTDSASYNIHWNLAKTLETQLKDNATAYDEYLSISRGYPGRDRRDAAFNAIALSEFLVAGEGKVVADSMAADSTALTPMEQKKVAALVNFYALYPEDEKSPLYRLEQGRMHYAHKDYIAATQLFDSLLVAYPQSAEAAEAVQLKLEALYALGRYQDAEAVARNIQQMALPQDVMAKARRRQAESVYSFADKLRQGEDHLKAAVEFRRMALDVPDADFADASLMDAGQEFTLGGDATQAVETYLYLADHYKASRFADQALSLAAKLSLDQLKDMPNAARIYERLALEYPQSDYARSSISNSSYCYLKSGDWASTIRMNGLYVERYPDADDASAVLFENAGLWLKLNKVTEANAIYADFAARYPQDPRTVQAYVERAEYFLRQKDEAAARTEYRQAVDRNRQLVKAGGDGSPVFASRALRRLVGWRFDEFRALALHQPAARLTQDLAAKKSARDGLLAELSELVQLGTGDLFYARHLVAATHEEFARAWREQERPVYATPVLRLQKEVEIQDAARELAKVAAESYIRTTQDLESAAEELRGQLRQVGQHRESLDQWLTAQPDSAAAREDSLALQVELLRATDLLDSSLTESSVWTGRSREAVPALVMATLDLFGERVDHALQIRSQYTDDPFLRLADTDKNILGGAVLATLQTTLEAWKEGMELIARAGLDRLWRPRAEEKLRVVTGKLPAAGLAFRRDAYGEFDAMVERFLAAVDKGENYTTPDGLTEEDLSADALDMADFCQGYAINSLLLTEKIMQLLADNELGSALVGDLSDSLAAQSQAWSAEIQARRSRLLVQKDEYWKRFESSASYVHRDAHTALDDAAYFLSKTAKEVLVQVEPVVTRTRPDSPNARRLLVALAEMDPATFGGRFGLSEQQRTELSSTSWLARNGYEEGFEAVEHDTGAWGQAQEVKRPGLMALLPNAMALWHGRPGQTQPADTALVASDSLLRQDALRAEGYARVDTTQGLERWVRAAREVVSLSADTVYFRTRFELAGTPVGAQLQLAADDAFAVFFNGEYIDEQEGPDGGVSELKTYTLDEFLKAGPNVLAVEVRDRDASGGGVTAQLVVKEIPRLTPEMLEAQISREAEAQHQLDFQRKVSRIHVKNRLD